MGRPAKDIRYRIDTASGRILVGFSEQPGSYHATPETEPTKAIAWAKRNRTRLLSGTSKPLLIKDMAKGFFDETGAWYRDQVQKGRSMTRASLGIRQGHVGNYIIPLFGDCDIRELTGAEIDRAILDMQRFTARRGSSTRTALSPLAKGTRSKLLYSIKLMYDRWIYLGLVKENPTASITKYSKEPERKRTALPRDAIEKLFPKTHGELVRVWGSSMWAACMLVMLDTGARPGEVRALNWADFYPEERFVPIRHGVEAGTSDKIKGTKTDNTKPGYLQERTVQELLIWHAESRHNSDVDFIFSKDGRAPISGAAIGDAFERGLLGQGFDATNWTPYYLRHTFVTMALEVLEDSELLMLAGHTSIITNQIYRHPDDQTLLRRSEKIRSKLLHRHTLDKEPSHRSTAPD